MNAKMIIDAAASVTAVALPRFNAKDHMCSLPVADQAWKVQARSRGLARFEPRVMRSASPLLGGHVPEHGAVRIEPLQFRRCDVVGICVTDFHCRNLLVEQSLDLVPRRFARRLI